jgi:hypothetical protein
MPRELFDRNYARRIESHFVLANLFAASIRYVALTTSGELLLFGCSELI